MEEKPQPEHEWLQKLVGEWTFESDCDMGPDQPSVTATGTEVVRSLGGLWVMAEGEGGPAGSGWRSVMTLGYDPNRTRFVGTFIATMMTYLWRYEGVLDGSGRVLTLDTEGPNFTDGSIVRYQDIIEVVGNDERTLSSQMLRADGRWHPFMKTRYRRTV